MNYKHGDWYCNPANEAEAKEIIERAVASGAQNTMGWRGNSTLYRYGVINGLVDCGVLDGTEYTIEQVRQKFPLPGEQQKEWNGEGLPPVGWHGEITWGRKVMWYECVICPGCVAYKFSTDEWVTSKPSALPGFKFRPLNTKSEKLEVITPETDVTITTTYGELALVYCVLGRASVESHGRSLWATAADLLGDSDHLIYAMNRPDFPNIDYLQIQEKWESLFFKSEEQQEKELAIKHKRDQIKKLQKEIEELEGE